jgi:hypothetical protein
VLICAAGDIHGAINQLYEDVLAFEVTLGATFDWVLHVGDFGVWPDPERIDRATRYHDGAGDFSERLRAMRRVPRQTIFIKGNHEDFAWLESQRCAEVLPGLVYLRNGCRMDLESASGGRIKVGGVGGCPDIIGAAYTLARPPASIPCLGVCGRWYASSAIITRG